MAMRSMSGSSATAVVLAVVLLASCPASATDAVHADYMLGCQGCHLDDGRGFPERGVPNLRGFVGAFVTVPGGREYLVQVPGSAQSDLSDERLAAVLNWMLRTFSPGELPADFAPYSASEVRRLRRSPLVTVTTTRADLVQSIANQRAQASIGARP